MTYYSAAEDPAGDAICCLGKYESILDFLGIQLHLVMTSIGQG